jgi:hypothetical protein
MRYRLDEATAILERTPAVLEAWLRGLPEVWTGANEGGETWSAFDIVGHLITGERADWMARTRIILEQGEGRVFDRFDRFAQFEASKGKSLDELLAEFARLRRQNLEALRALQLKEEDLTRRGRHPGLGAVTLGNLLATWAAHDLNHLHQLARVLATQYREAVGPWADYMGVMRCAGHSDAPKELKR